ncbi:hypothetical protein GCM10023213_05380 [Prosthecobacter algae]|uniref:Uncharacterized protein n=2 Tax=Prosthecobacter algae TaxID=1144682 RepID=A0ABP9NUN0_9BACT
MQVRGRMSDPRNAAHDKKVSHDKKHQETAEAAPVNEPEVTEAAPAAGGASPEEVAHREASLAVLTQIKDMEFHSRGNLARLGALMLTVEDELKQKVFAVALGDLFSAQDHLQNQLTAFITAYQAECESL